MLRQLICFLFAALAVTFPVSDRLWAHPGHGITPAEQPAHYVVEPIHGWPILLMIGAAILLWRRYRSRA